MDPTVNQPAANEIAQWFDRDLLELHLRAGAPSYSALEKASKHELKRATVSDRLNGKRTGLPDWSFVFTFVNACRDMAKANGLDLEDLGTVADWKQRWDSAKRGNIDAHFPGRSRQRAPSGNSPGAESANEETPDEHPEQGALILPREGETVWGPVPPPINDFVGRERFLDDLHRAFLQDERAGALTIQGAAGIGKTQLAAEYARRHRLEYDLVWWISCATQDDALRGMSGLAFRLSVATTSRVLDENQLTAVFDKLRLSRELARWLLIFDGANDPEEIRNLIPPERQNVLITSRNYEWSSSSRILELDVFKRTESVEFLLQQRRGIRDAEAHSLADALGDIPLALEHAVESPFQTSEYLDRLESDAVDLFSGNPPSAYPDTIAHIWRMVIDKLRAEAPDAMALLGCLAFFSSAPIPRESMERGRYNQAVSLHQVLRDPVRFSRAIGALRRMGVLSIRPGVRPAFRIHRLTQRIVRNKLSEAEAEQSRHDVHLLLAAADPTNPDDPDSWLQYEALRDHMDASDILGCQDVNVRFLVINFVRYLCASGNPKIALSRAHDALGRWASRAGSEEPDPESMDLAMYRAEAEALCSLGSFDQASEVCRSTLSKMQSATDRWKEEITALGRIAGARLRRQGDFANALMVDTESKEQHIAVFGSDHPQTFMAMHDLSVDHALNGMYAEAAHMADEVYWRCRTFYGRPDHPFTLFQQNALARSKFLSGRYDEALEMMNEVNARYRSIVEKNVLREDHPWFLLHGIDLVAVRRDVKSNSNILEHLADEIYRVYWRCWKIFGMDHTLTLAAAVTRGSLLRRIPGRLDAADALVTKTQQSYSRVLGNGHPYTSACGTLLESIRRQLVTEEKLETQVNFNSDFMPLPLWASP